MDERLCRCGKQLTPDQKAYCSKPCRLEGMRAAKAAKHEPDIHEDEHEPQYHPPKIADWRRPEQDREAMQSYHRRPPG